jgi:hypothetical protein
MKGRQQFPGPGLSTFFEIETQLVENEGLPVGVGYPTLVPNLQKDRGIEVRREA